MLYTYYMHVIYMIYTCYIHVIYVLYTYNVNIKYILCTYIHIIYIYTYYTYRHIIYIFTYYIHIILHEVDSLDECYWFSCTLQYEGFQEPRLFEWHMVSLTFLLLFSLLESSCPGTGTFFFFAQIHCPVQGYQKMFNQKQSHQFQEMKTWQLSATNSQETLGCSLFSWTYWWVSLKMETPQKWRLFFLETDKAGRRIPNFAHMSKHRHS